MSKISWGKPSIYIQDAEVPQAPWLKIPTPVKDSTTLEVEDGETQEAEVEGGELEDEKTGKNKSTLTFEIRAAKNRHLIVADDDGVISHHHRIAVIPEDPNAPGLLIDKGSMHATPSYTCAEGIKRSYKTKALVPDDESHMVKIGKMNVTKSGDVVTDITCDEEKEATNTVSASPASLSFAASDDSPKSVSISGASAITSASPNRGWLTVTFDGTTISVKAAANENTSSRKATITVIANGETVKIPVEQAGAAA